MQTAKRRFDSGVIDALVAEPYRFEFFQAVRLLALEFARKEGLESEAIIGERIRFRDSISLVFPASEIEGIGFEVFTSPDEATPPSPSRYHMTPTFIGLTGPSGVLPRHYTERLAQRDYYHRDRAAQAFFNQFTNRIVTLFYRAWTKYRLHLQYEQDRRERFLPLVLSVSGLAGTGMRERLLEGKGSVHDEALAYYAAANWQRAKSASMLARIVADYFDVKAELKQFIGRWFEIPREQCTALGSSSATLGKDTFCGQRVWQRQTRMRLTIGPLPRKRFLEFLPRGEAAEALAKLVTLLMGVTYEYEVRLVLRKQDSFPARLGDTAEPARLGWDTFLDSRVPTQDRADAAYEILPGIAA